MTVIYEISSGNSPSECELAVTKLAEYIGKNYKIEILDTSGGFNKGTYRFVKFSTDEDLSEFIGSVLWVCKSPYRPDHKRKNWFIDFKLCDAEENVVFDPKKVVFSTLHSGGHGGQNVNKVETGVRAIYTVTGDMTVCTDERSQYANKKKALSRLEKIISSRNVRINNCQQNEMRKEHINLKRGNAVAKFVGKEFKRVY